MRISSDYSRSMFDFYPSSTLNTHIDLINTVHPETAIYDMIVDNVVKVSVSRGIGTEIFDLDVEQDLSATAFYAQHVPNLQYGYKHTLYNRTINNVDEDQCGALCVNVYPAWCQSYDYFFFNQTCSLSVFRKSQVGGLTNRVFLVEEQTYPLAHYDLRRQERVMDSQLIVDGKLKIVGNVPPAHGAFPFQVDVDVEVGGDLTVQGAANVTFTRHVQLLETSITSLSDLSKLSLSGAESKLDMTYGALLQFTASGVSGAAGLLEFSEGLYHVNGKVNGTYSLHALDAARLFLYPTNTSTVGSDTVTRNTSALTIQHLVVSGASVVMAGHNHNFITAQSVSVTEGGALASNNLDLTATLFVWVDTTSVISANGRGFGTGLGPGAGAHNQLGASGGAHAGRGGPSKVDATGQVYGSLEYPGTAGSGGGRGFFLNSTSGHGGGVLRIVCTLGFLDIDGVLSADGAKGAAAGGGGAGGSIFISTDTLQGTGLLSAAGGDGDFSGGIAAGGGGSGGRIGIHAETLSFTGDFDITGGFTQPTYDRPALEQAAPGLVYVSIDNTYRAVITSTQLFGDYVTNIQTRTPLLASELAVSTGYAYRGAQILTAVSNACVTDFHVIGAAPLEVRSPTVCLRPTVGSGPNATMRLLSGVVLSLTNNQLNVNTDTLELYGASFSALPNVTVTGKGRLVLVDPSNSASYTFAAITVRDNGTFISPNTSLTLNAQSVRFLQNSTVFVGGLLHIKSAQIALRDTTIGAWHAAGAPQVVLNATQSTTFQDEVKLVRCPIVAGKNVHIYHNAVVKAIHADDTTSSLSLQGTSEVHPSATLTTAGAPLYINTAVQLDAGASLIVAGGGSCGATGVVNTASAAQLIVETDTFALTQACKVQGLGQTTVRSHGVLRPPMSTPATTLDLHVQATGRVEFFQSGQALSSRYDAIIFVESGGFLLVANGTALSVAKLSLDQGELRFSSVTSSIELYGAANPFLGGLVQGNGSLTIATGARLSLTPTSASALLTFLEVAVYNYGTIEAANFDVNFARAAGVTNYGEIYFGGTQQWLHDEQLYDYLNLEYCTTSLQPSVQVIEQGLSAVECARECSHHQLLRTQQANLGFQVVSSLNCQSFLYNAHLQTCQLQSAPVQTYAACAVATNMSAARYDWLLYVKRFAWTQVPVLHNTATGVIRSATSSAAGVQISILNDGLILVDSGAALTVSGTMNQTSAAALRVYGTVSVTQSGYSPLSGAIIGNGTLQFSTRDSNNDSTIILSGLSLNAPQLTLQLQGRVRIEYNTSRLSVYSVVLQDCHVLVAQSPLELDIVSTLSLSGNSSLTSAAGVSSELSAAHRPNPITGLVTCRGCFDLYISSKLIQLADQSTIGVSNGYITASNITVSAQSSISASKRGYSLSNVNQGNSSAWAGAYRFLGSSGGSFGGLGGAGYSQKRPNFDQFSNASSYGDFTHAARWGTPGGVGVGSTSSAGGGSVHVFVTGLVLDGKIQSNGMSIAASLAGGGSGGSVHVAARVLSGIGTISAVGGRGGKDAQNTIAQGGGGGGGRISLFVDNLSGFTGTMTAAGGLGFQKGSAGTIFTTNSAASNGGKLLVANVNDGEFAQTSLSTILNTVSPYGILQEIRVMQTAHVIYRVPSLVVSATTFVGDGTGALMMSKSSTLLPYGSSGTPKSLTINGINLIIATGAKLDATSVQVGSGAELRLTPAGSTSASAHATYVFDSVNILSGGVLKFDYHTVVYPSSTPVPSILLNVTGNLTIALGGKMHSDAQGFQGSSSYLDHCYDSSVRNVFGHGVGCGQFGTMGGGGAGYGGTGGAGYSAHGGVSNGDVSNYIAFGNGGGGCFPHLTGGTGGGIVRATAKNLHIDGTISADGHSGSGSGTGGGSGGSILLHAENVAGSGTIQANGGAGLYSTVYVGGAGAGGRITITCEKCTYAYHSHTGPRFSFAGNTTAYGGYYKLSKSPSAWKQVPIAGDLGDTALDWLQTQPARAAAGTILWKTGVAGVDKSLIVRNALPSTFGLRYTISLHGIERSNYTATALAKSSSQFDNNYAFTSITLASNAQLRVQPGQVVQSTFVFGDSSSLLAVSNASTLVLAPTIELHSVNLQLAGALVGAQNLTLSGESVLGIYPNATWSKVINSVHRLPSTGSVHHGITSHTSILNTTSVVLTNQAGIEFYGGDAYANKRAILYCDELTMRDVGTFISADNFGYSSSGPGSTDVMKVVNSSSIHPPHQASGNISYADGGWHAGRGGGAYYVYPTAGVAFFPIEFGAAGGSNAQYAGGAGGGAVRVIARSHVHVAGKISSNGQSCDSLNTAHDALRATGGGAGGSVWIEVLNGNLTGSGSIEAIGGDGCLNGGGGGSGGRVSVFTETADFIAYTGSVSVRGGGQSSAIEYAPEVSAILPSGGTIFVARSDGSAGTLTSSNSGVGGSEVYAFDSCNYNVGGASFSLERIIQNDADLVVDGECLVRLSSGVLSSTYAPFFPTPQLTNATSSGILWVRDGATVAVQQPLSLDEAQIAVDTATLAFNDNVALTNSAALFLSMQGARVLSLPSSTLAGSDSALISALASSPAPSSYVHSAMSYIELSSLSLRHNSSVSVFASVFGNLTQSNAFIARNISISASSFISAAGVLYNPELTYLTTGTNAAQFGYYGKHSGSSFAASGGGHAGRGSPGAGRDDSALGGASRGDSFTPYGLGGPGGADVSLGILGGAGGGGLYFNVSEQFVIDGLIDVSALSAQLGSSAGGGAGGSIFIDASLAVVSGSGQLVANGGNGSVARNSALHGGAGSAGLISIKSCADVFSGKISARGGLTVDLPSGLADAVSTVVYQQYSHALNLSHIGTSGYLSMQSVIAAPSGTVLRSALFTTASQPNARTTCQSHYALKSSTQYDLQSLRVRGWEPSDLFLDSSALVAAMSSTLKLSSARKIPSVYNMQTMVTLPATSGVTTVSTKSVALKNANVKLTGSGTVSVADFSHTSVSAFTTAGSVTVTPAAQLIINNFTYNLTEKSVISPGSDLLVRHGGKLLVNYENMTDDFVSNPRALYNPASDAMPPLTFRGVQISNNSGIYGSRIIMTVQSVEILVNSTFSADGLGLFGGRCGIAPASPGSGIGGGASGEVGGNGGGYAGYGAPGLSAWYRLINSDQYVGSETSQVVMNDAALSLQYPNGTTYGDLFAPQQYGSGGGATSCPSGGGGRGGGVIVLHVADDVTIDESSSLSADGQGVYGGGGGGAGGSIWILDNNADPVDVHGHVIGYGRVSARGGSTCPIDGCSVSIDFPGGTGGGGRIHIDKTLERYYGAVNVLSGVANQTLDLLLTKRMGTFVRVQAISTLVLGHLSDGRETLDVIFTQTPLFMVQVISTSGTGNGSLSADHNLDAVVKGFWTLRYRSQGAESIKLSSQATASEVRDALWSLGISDLNHIGVTRRPSGGNGWSWSITFYDEVDRVVPIKVDGTHLFTDNYDSALTVKVLNPHFDALDGSGDLIDTDAPANFTVNQMRNLMTFNKPVFSNISSGHWLNYRTFRVVPNYSNDTNYFHDLLYVLRLTSFKPVATMLGRITSTSYPYLLETYLPNWKFPSSQPTGQPSNQPSGRPSGQPSSQPSMQPSNQPSSQPTEQPTSQPSRQPSSEPSGQPSVQPSSRPTGQPSSQPSQQPSSQPSSHPSNQPTSQPSSHPTGQPTTQPSMQPSAQPVATPTSQPSSQPSMQPSAQPNSAPTGQPSSQPSMQPSGQPVGVPTGQPSGQPVSRPTGQPSRQPTGQPTGQPVSRPTGQPSRQPSSQPTRQPTSQPSSRPTRQPTGQPSRQPTGQPSSHPSRQPSSQPSRQPSSQPSSQPTNPTGQPSSQPTNPTGQPTSKPSIPTSQPTNFPSSQPSMQPTTQPTSTPTNPTAQPSNQPSSLPTSQPSGIPTGQPSGAPSGQPSSAPSGQPSGGPSSQPSRQPSSQPSGQPSRQPTSQPSHTPSGQPSSRPTTQPVAHPTSQPSGTPSAQPSAQPVCHPTARPSGQPSSHPTRQPTSSPSVQPSSCPSGQPSAQPVLHPTSQPTMQPSSQPTSHPTHNPLSVPTSQPSSQPSARPSRQPSSQPTSTPTMPTGQPSSRPSDQPSSQPTSSPSCPSSQPSARPSAQPSERPSVQPSGRPSEQPSSRPSSQPSERPTGQPSAQPIQEPTSRPSSLPTTQPSSSPSTQPSSQPSTQPTSRPSPKPTPVPSAIPTADPTVNPTANPTVGPSAVPTATPTESPTDVPTVLPTETPTAVPTETPTADPSALPTALPTAIPTNAPTDVPTEIPTALPTAVPTIVPTADPSAIPTESPTADPTMQPTAVPSADPTAIPTATPTAVPTVNPSASPTEAPTADPTEIPTAIPTVVPTALPTATPTAIPSAAPSVLPTQSPTADPTAPPSVLPTAAPSELPTASPSEVPTEVPSASPTETPTATPSAIPTASPSAFPTAQPTALPSVTPTESPSADPTIIPSATPTATPSAIPTETPTAVPTATPSADPSAGPTAVPTEIPTATPTELPTANPTANPTAGPTIVPTEIPTANPTETPTARPSEAPTAGPTVSPTVLPTETPTATPTTAPSTALPSETPTAVPTAVPTALPTEVPSETPTASPSAQPTETPTEIPTITPTEIPTEIPTNPPSEQPTVDPTDAPSLPPV